MISLVEAHNFRCLRYVRQPLRPFHVLVGPNASGKTTFLDVVSFLGRLVSAGLEKAIEERSANFQDLLWMRTGDRFELAVEARIPEDVRAKLHAGLRDREYDTVRYEMALGIDPASEEVQILAETAVLKQEDQSRPGQRTLFPEEPTPPPSILMGTGTKRPRRVLSKVRGGNDNYHMGTGTKRPRRVLSKVRGGNDNYYPDGKEGKGWVPAYRLGPRRSALGNLPEDETKFPTATWLKGLLTEGVQQFVLNSLLIRKPSPPGQERRFKPDGSNLPWVVARLQREAPERYNDWIAHIRTALQDVEAIRTVERPEDRHCYLTIRYRGGLEVPSWLVSDGTLRLLALTLPAYLPEFRGVFLVEEPENGIHPRAVETVFQSLSSVYNAQVLLATHSPVILSSAKPQDVLCFAKTGEGATDIVSGTDHPALAHWRGEINLSELFAAGVLG